jgi:hypothetical protein
MGSFFRSLIHFLLLFCSFQFRRLDSILDNKLLCATIYIAEHFLYQLCTDYAENTASIVKEACLLIRCPAVGILLLRAFICFCGNVFTESFPSNWYTGHNILYIVYTYFCNEVIGVDPCHVLMLFTEVV